MAEILPLLIVILPVLVVVKIGKDQSSSCKWDYAQSANKMLGGIFMTAAALIAGIWKAPLISIFGGARALLLWYGSYQLAKAIYRRRHIRATGESAISEPNSGE